MTFNPLSGSGDLNASGLQSTGAFTLSLGYNLEDIFSEPPRDTSSPTQRTSAPKKGVSRLPRDLTDGTMDSIGETVISSWSFLRAARGSNSCGMTNNGDVTSPTTSDVETSGYVDVSASNHFSNAMLPSGSEEEHSVLELWNEERLMDVPTPVLKSSPVKNVLSISTSPVVANVQKPLHVNPTQHIRPHSLHPAVVPLPSQQSFMTSQPPQIQCVQQMQPYQMQMPMQQQQQQPQQQQQQPQQQQQQVYMQQMPQQQQLQQPLQQQQQQQQGYTVMVFNPSNNGNANLMSPVPINSQPSLMPFGVTQTHPNAQQGPMQMMPQQAVNMYTNPQGPMQFQTGMPNQHPQQQETQTYLQMTLPTGQVVAVPARAVYITSNNGFQPQPMQMSAMNPSPMLQFSNQNIASQPVSNFCTSTSPSQTVVNGQFGLDVQRSVAAAPAQRVKHIYNVHSALSEHLRFFSYTPTDASDAATCLPDDLAAPAVPLFFQMLPTEHMGNAAQLLNRIISVTSTLPDNRDDGKFVSERTANANNDVGAPNLGTVVTTDNRNQSLTSLIALVRTSVTARLIHKLRSRVLLDRHGFWYAENMEQYMKLKEYCESIRMLPHKERHLRTDGLPCMPLVVELSRSVKGPSISQVVLPKTGVSAPAPIPFDCITPIQCSRPKE